MTEETKAAMKILDGLATRRKINPHDLHHDDWSMPGQDEWWLSDTAMEDTDDWFCVRRDGDRFYIMYVTPDTVFLSGYEVIQYVAQSGYLASKLAEPI